MSRVAATPASELAGRGAHGATERTVRTASERAAAAVRERNRQIRELHAAGATLRDIAAATGTLTHSAIARIVKRSTD